MTISPAPADTTQTGGFPMAAKKKAPKKKAKK
jgi:hypothetical protein